MLSGSSDEKYRQALAPYLDIIRSEILPNIDENKVSKTPSYYGVSYHQQVKLALSGDFNAMRRVATLLYYGVHIPQDKNLAIDFLKTLAFGPRGITPGFNPPSAYSYAKILLKEGQSEASVNILQRLINSNFTPAMALMGNIYQYGSGIEPSFEKADHFYKKAQSRGHLYATILRAKLHKKNKGLKSKIKSAVLFLSFIRLSIKYEFCKNKDDDHYNLFY